MIVASITGTIITELQETKTASGIHRINFVIQSEDEGSLPLRYACVAFGKIGERAVKEIKLGTGAQIESLKNNAATPFGSKRPLPEPSVNSSPSQRKCNMAGLFGHRPMRAKQNQR